MVDLLQVNVANVSGDKDGFSVSLCICADGRKLPAVIVFKDAAETGELSEKIMSKLNVPSDLVVTSSKSAWWSQNWTTTGSQPLFRRMNKRRRLFATNSLCTKLSSSGELCEHPNVRQIFVSIAMTGSWQPLNVGRIDHLNYIIEKNTIRYEIQPWMF